MTFETNIKNSLNKHGWALSVETPRIDEMIHNGERASARRRARRIGTGLVAILVVGGAAWASAADHRGSEDVASPGGLSQSDTALAMKAVQEELVRVGGHAIVATAKMVDANSVRVVTNTDTPCTSKTLIQLQVFGNDFNYGVGADPGAKSSVANQEVDLLADSATGDICSIDAVSPTQPLDPNAAVLFDHR